MGESDRMVTVLTKERGLVRAIAPGARKHKSKLAGRSGLFVVNDLLFVKGKSIDKLIQAETVRSFPGLSKDLAKLTASQYLAEIALSQALTDQPQEELYYLLLEHLSRLEAAAKPNVLACLAQATFHLLALAGVAPEVFRCSLSRTPLIAELGNPDWRVGFSVSSGGAIDTAEIHRIEAEQLQETAKRMSQYQKERADSQVNVARPLVATPSETPVATEESAAYTVATPAPKMHKSVSDRVSREVARNLGIVTYLSAAELALMQQLSKPELVLSSSLSGSLSSPLSGANGLTNSTTHRQFAQQSGTIEKVPSSASGNLLEGQSSSGPHVMWRHIEKALRHYAQYQIDRPIRSADLIDSCFI